MSISLANDHFILLYHEQSTASQVAVTHKTHLSIVHVMSIIKQYSSLFARCASL